MSTHPSQQGRGVIAFGLPLVLLGFIVGMAFLFGRLLLAMDHSIAVWVALMTAFNLLAFFTFMSSRIGKANPVEKVLALGVLVVPVVLGTAVAADIIKVEGGHGTEGPEQVHITLVTRNLAFDTNEITMPAATEVTVTVDNEDTQPHNFMMFEGADASAPPVNDGQPIANAGQSVDYVFTSPANPGDYFFYCQIHPVQMTGTVHVTEAAHGEGEGEGEGGDSLALSAENLAFDKNELTATAGEEVTIALDNKDSQPHNLMVFEGPDQSAPPLNDGQPFANPGQKVEYTLTAPATPGEYFFYCQIHPTMTGKLVVQ